MGSSVSLNLTLHQVGEEHGQVRFDEEAPVGAEPLVSWIHMTKEIHAKLNSPKSLFITISGMD